MTIIIAVATQDGALIVADGRITQTLTFPSTSEFIGMPIISIADDKKQKITQVTPMLAVGRLGVETRMVNRAKRYRIGRATERIKAR